MEDFSKASLKKPRYFLNSYTHRFKLHCLQPILFCESDISKRTIEILVNEILTVNNQLNVTYLIEIILARYYTIENIFNILRDGTQICNLKAPAIRSLISILIMQIKKEDTVTEFRMEVAHDIIASFAMGQNYSIRSTAQAAIVILYEHMKKQFRTSKPEVMSRIEKTCDIINESMKFKNASKLFKVLIDDFRYNLKFSEIWTESTFYYNLPKATEMSIEEIVQIGKPCELNWKISELEEIQDKTRETETVVCDGLELGPAGNSSSMALTNFQQKYLPHKYQIPSWELLTELPEIFKSSLIDIESRKVRFSAIFFL